MIGTARKSHLRPTGATTYIFGAILNRTKKQQVSLTKNVIPGQYLGLSPCKKNSVKHQSKGNIRLSLKANTVSDTGTQYNV